MAKLYYPEVTYTEDENTQLNVFVDIQSYIQQTEAKFITGEMDIDTEWDSYIQNLESMGVDNLDICCGGQVVHPGDIIVGDADGIVVVRAEDAKCILEKLQGVKEKEELINTLINEKRWETESPILTAVNSQIEQLGFGIIL